MKKKKGFTLAEVLITLTIIGVVTALTIPSLLTNVSDKTYNAKRKGLATRMAQAISQIGTITAYEAIAPAGSTETDYAQKYSSMNFITEALSKVYNIATICEYDNKVACDFPKRVNRGTSAAAVSVAGWEKFSNINDFVKNGPALPVDYYGALFRTKNNESFMLFYNPKCVTEQDVDPITKEKNFAEEICVNIIYDLDGSRKGPNELGKDIGYMTVFYADAPYLVAPNPPTTMLWNATVTKKSFSASDPANTTAKGICDNATLVGSRQGTWTLPSKEELYAASINYTLYETNLWLWSDSVEGTTGDDYGWQIQQYQLKAKKALRSTDAYVECIVGDNQ